MDFKQNKPKKRNEENYHIENLKIAREFSKGVITEMNELVRSVVIFGSNTNDTLRRDSDIDIMVVLNNVSVFVTDELREAYKIITKKLNNDVANNRIHLMTINLSDLWDTARKGDPIMINILRFGQPIFDRDLIEPMQFLLEIGRIRPSKESIFNYMSRAETLFEETDKHIQNSVLDLYYALIDMVHSTLMSLKITPPSPKEMPEIFAKKFKGEKLAKYSKDIKLLYKYSKDIEKGKKFTGKELDDLKEKVRVIIKDLKEFVDKQVQNDEFEY